MVVNLEQYSEDKPFEVNVNDNNVIEVCASSVHNLGKEILIDTNLIIQIPKNHIGMIFLKNMEQVNLNAIGVVKIIQHEDYREGETLKIILNANEFEPKIEIESNIEDSNLTLDAKFDYNEAILEDFSYLINTHIIDIVIVEKPNITFSYSYYK